MNLVLFKRWGMIYRPISWRGSFICMFAAVFCVSKFMAVDKGSHSASDTLYGFAPYFALTALALLWVAAKTSRSPS